MILRFLFPFVDIFGSGRVHIHIYLNLLTDLKV